MAIENLKQITKSANKTKIIEFNDNMHFNNFQGPFGINKSTVHSKISKINITIVDFTNGNKDKTIVLKHNVDPSVMKAISLQILSNRKDLFVNGIKEQKINFHKKDEEGYSSVSGLLIKYQEKMQNPWTVEIVNGKGIAVKNQTGGSIIKKGSYIETSKSAVYMSEMEFIIKMNEVRDYIEHFEIINMSKMIQVRNKMEQRIRNESQSAKMQVIQGGNVMEAEI